MKNNLPDAQRNPAPKYERPNNIPVPALTPRELSQRLEEIKAFVAGNRQSLSVVATTRTKSGQEIDWIRPESQIKGGKLASPPPTHNDISTDPERPTSLAGFELETDKDARGPEGCVPVMRVNVEQLGAMRSRSLQDYLSKHGSPARLLQLKGDTVIPLPGDNFDHRYATSIQTVNCYGGEGYINVWKPYVQWSTEMSLGQIAISRGSIQQNKLQTVEAGWQVCPSLYNDWDAHIFSFYTINNYTELGNNKGGYNRCVTGWKQVSTTIFPGAKLSPTSVFNGLQREMPVKYQLYQGNWWLRVMGEWIGYYPASLFSSSGLKTMASAIRFYGEVADDPNQAGSTKTDMGSGAWPSPVGFSQVAYMRNLRYQSTSGGTMQRYKPQIVTANWPYGYGILGDFLNINFWQSQFWWGGPGIS